MILPAIGQLLADTLADEDGDLFFLSLVSVSGM